MSIKRKIAALFMAMMVFATAACQSSPATTPEGSKETNPAGPAKVQAANLLENFTAQPVEDKKADEAFIRAGFDVASQLFRTVYAQEKSKTQRTTLISPLSIATALAMTANGAKGLTLQQMENLLTSNNFKLEDLNAYLHTYMKGLEAKQGAQFAFANSIWFNNRADFTVENDFLQRNVNYFDAQIRKAPFNADTVRDINEWVSMKTNQMIPKLLETLNEEDRMLLINALVFEAKWMMPFREELKTKGVFNTLAGTEQEASYMSNMEGYYLEDEGSIGFMKLYEQGEYGFVALLPKDGTDFNAFVDSLNGARLQSLMENMQERPVNITMPAFNYDYDTSLSEVLKSLGMNVAFDGNAADFSGISQDTPLHISDVIHKTHIEVDSEGTKAAAVTAVIVAAGSFYDPDMPEVTLDRPFVYMIVDVATGLPIFIGSVTELAK